MKNKGKKNNDTKKILITFAAILIIVIIISSSTYSYWRWESLTTDNGGNESNTQQTNVNVTVRGGSLSISGANVSTNGVTLYPISRANCETSALIGTAKVDAVNGTETPMTVTLKLKGTLEAAQGTLNTNVCASGGNKDCLKWAVVETNSEFAPITSGQTCANATYTGTFKNVSSNTDIASGITWTAEEAETQEGSESEAVTTTKYYKVYVWLDSGYTWTNYGNTVSDPMQNLKITLTWSTNSTLEQS